MKALGPKLGLIRKENGSSDDAILTHFFFGCPPLNLLCDCRSSSAPSRYVCLGWWNTGGMGRPYPPTLWLKEIFLLTQAFSKKTLTTCQPARTSNRLFWSKTRNDFRPAFFLFRFQFNTIFHFLFLARQRKKRRTFRIACRVRVRYLLCPHSPYHQDVVVVVSASSFAFHNSAFQ